MYFLLQRRNTYANIWVKSNIKIKNINILIELKKKLYKIIYSKKIDWKKGIKKVVKIM